MAIRLNARPQQWKAETLFAQFAEIWKNARNSLMAASPAGYVAFWSKTQKSMKAIQKLLGTNTVADFEVPFRSTFNWDLTKWNEFRTSAIAVYGTHVPAALAEIALHKAKLMNTDIDANGDEVHVDALTQPEIDAISSALQAIENQYSLES